MLAYLLEKFQSWMEAAEYRYRDNYLCAASDLADLERRMRVVETDV